MLQSPLRLGFCVIFQPPVSLLSYLSTFGPCGMSLQSDRLSRFRHLSHVRCLFALLTLFRAGASKTPFRFFLCHGQTPQDIQLILGDFS